MPRQSAGYYIDTGNHQNRVCKMADNMIERVAKALYKAGWAHTDADDEVIQEEWDSSVKHRVQHRFKARAAIKAMREPSDEMIKDGALTEGMRMVDELLMFSAAHGKFIKQSEQGTPLHQAWQAMIDAALHEDE